MHAYDSKHNYCTCTDNTMHNKHACVTVIVMNNEVSEAREGESAYKRDWAWCEH